MEKLPNKIEPDYINEAVIEIRFNPKIPSNAVFGLIYENVREDFNKFEETDLNNLPIKLLEEDSNLRYKPLHRASKEPYIIQIGPRVITLINKEPYQGWSKFFKFFKKIISNLSCQDLLYEIKRLGIRYINIMENIDLFVEASRINITLGDLDFPAHSIMIDSINADNKIKIRSKIGNNIPIKTDVERTCSIIDIDVYIDENLPNNIDKMFSAINEMHDFEKKTFFSYLKDDFVEKHVIKE